MKLQLLISGIGIFIILLGYLIYKTKAYQFISGYEFYQWKEVDMDRFLKIFFRGSVFIGLGILITPWLLFLSGYEKYAYLSIPAFVFSGIIYITLAGIRLPGKS